MPTEYPLDESGAGLSVAIVAARYNDIITQPLVRGAIEFLEQAGSASESIAVFWVPGALELPAVAAHLARGGPIGQTFDAIVVIGCVIRGDTDHYDHVSREAISGVSQLALEGRAAIGNAILTVHTLEQALERSGAGHLNKGFEAAQAAVAVANLYRKTTRRS